jgi:hypothetical protein
MKEWKRSMNEKAFFNQDFVQGEMFMVDGYFYTDDVKYYAQEKGLTIERITNSKVPQEYKDKADKNLFFVVANTRFQIPGHAKAKPIETSLADIL